MSIVSLSAISIKLSCRPAILEHWVQNNIVTMIYNIMIHVTEIDTFTKIKLFSKLKIINNIRFGLSKPLHHHHRSKITRSNSLRPMQFILPASVTLLTTGSHTPLQLTSFADYTHTHTHTHTTASYSSIYVSFVSDSKNLIPTMTFSTPESAM